VGFLSYVAAVSRTSEWWKYRQNTVVWAPKTAFYYGGASSVTAPYLAPQASTPDHGKPVNNRVCTGQILAFFKDIPVGAYFLGRRADDRSVATQAAIGLTESPTAY
jgi:hypothetical protein